MKKLKKYKLNLDKAYEYVKSNLDETNLLSCELLNFLNFKKGFFFTWMPDNINPDKLHYFESGGIVPQQSIKEYINGQIKHYSIVQTVRDEIAVMLFKELKMRAEINCFFDDILASPSSSKRRDLLETHGIYYEKEVYYYIQNKDVSLDLIKKCFHYSTNGWHSLCVLTKTAFDSHEKQLTVDKIREIVFKTYFIILQAYDGEGFIFWELEAADMLLPLKRMGF